MSLIEIEYGSLASSKDLNDNFNFLASQISTLSDNISTKVAGFSSNVATLNSSINKIMDLKESFIQVGTIVFSLKKVIPDGFLLCDGSELLVSDFEDLYDVIGTTFGSSDSTKFCLPDLRNKTLWGANSSSLFEYKTSKLPNLKGTFRLSGTENSSSVTGAFSAGKKGGSRGYGHDSGSVNPLMTFDASTYPDAETSIYSDECTIVQPPAVTGNFIIKY